MLTGSLRKGPGSGGRSGRDVGKAGRRWRPGQGSGGGVEAATELANEGRRRG